MGHTQGLKFVAAPSTGRGTGKCSKVASGRRLGSDPASRVSPGRHAAPGHGVPSRWRPVPFNRCTCARLAHRRSYGWRHTVRSLSRWLLSLSDVHL